MFAVALALSALSAFPASAPATATQSRASGNPAENRAPSRATLLACLISKGGKRACEAHALADIARARRNEGVPPMALPKDYRSLSVPERLLAIADLERVDRGLPPVLGLTRGLDAAAREGALRGADPLGPEGYSWASNWAGGARSPLFDDFVWMYDDGAGSGNLDCQHPGDAGCWGHRDDILAALEAPRAMGAAIHGASLTELFVGGYRPAEPGNGDPLLAPDWAQIAHTRPARAGR
jgi:hypothetical protein